jgi:hypothetical protein
VESADRDGRKGLPIGTCTVGYHEKGESDGKGYEYHDRLTDIWIKSAGKWQVVSSHYSVPFKP